MKKLIFHGESYSTSANIGLFIFRVFIGLSMAFSHGLSKVPPSEGFIGGLGSMGFPLPEFSAWAAGLAEFAGALLLVLGLATRFSAVMLGFTMAVAAFVVHGADPYAKQEMALLYMFACVLLFAAGSGKYSVDRLIK